MNVKEKLTRAERIWILYDCGNSAYSIAITTALLPLFIIGLALFSRLPEQKGTHTAA